MVKISTYFKTKTFLFLGFFFLAYIIYIRLLLERLPAELKQNLLLNKNYSLFIIYTIIVCFFLFSLLLQIKIFLKLEIKPNKIILFIANIINNSLTAVDNFIKEKLFREQIGDWISNYGLFCYKYYGKYGSLFPYFIISLIIIPKLIVLVAFSIDILIFHKFNYVYKFSAFLLIPLVIDYLDYLLRQFCKDNIPILDYILCIYNSTTDTIVKIPEIILAHLGIKNYSQILTQHLRYGLTMEYIKDQGNETFSFEKTVEYHLSNLNDFLLPIAIYTARYTVYHKNSILPGFNLFLSLIYFLLWVYILIYSC